MLIGQTKMANRVITTLGLDKIKENSSMTNTQNKLFIIKKYIMAKSASDAIKKDKKSPVDDVCIDDEWRKNNVNKPEQTVGFISK